MSFFGTHKFNDLFLVKKSMIFSEKKMYWLKIDDFVGSKMMIFLKKLKSA